MFDAHPISMVLLFAQGVKQIINIYSFFLIDDLEYARVCRSLTVNS